MTSVIAQPISGRATDTVYLRRDGGNTITGIITPDVTARPTDGTGETAGRDFGSQALPYRGLNASQMHIVGDASIAPVGSITYTSPDWSAHSYPNEFGFVFEVSDATATLNNSPIFNGTGSIFGGSILAFNALSDLQVLNVGNGGMMMNPSILTFSSPNVLNAILENVASSSYCYNFGSITHINQTALNGKTSRIRCDGIGAMTLMHIEADGTNNNLGEATGNGSLCQGIIEVAGLRDTRLASTGVAASTRAHLFSGEGDSQGDGSTVIGIVAGATSSPSTAEMIASGDVGIVWGMIDDGGAVSMYAVGRCSAAWGYNGTTNAVIEALAENSWQWFIGSNPEPNSLQAGESGDGIAFKALSGPFGTPNNGQIYNNAGSVEIHSRSLAVGVHINQSYTVNGSYTNLRTFDATTATLDDLRRVLGTLIDDMKVENQLNA
jgi:hypothetical protein